MKKLNFLVVAKNREIRDTRKRMIENNKGWLAELQNNKASCCE